MGIVEGDMLNGRLNQEFYFFRWLNGRLNWKIDFFLLVATKLEAPTQHFIQYFEPNFGFSIAIKLLTPGMYCILMPPTARSDNYRRDDHNCVTTVNTYLTYVHTTTDIDFRK